jgi:competence protein ComEA
MKTAFVRSFAALLMLLAVLAVQPVVGMEKPIDINKAPVSELVKINGIGNAKAQAIIDYREKNGAFKSVDELTLVHGIGDKTLERLRPQITVGSEEEGEKPKAGKK